MRVENDREGKGHSENHFRNSETALRKQRRKDEGEKLTGAPALSLVKDVLRKGETRKEKKTVRVLIRVEGVGCQKQRLYLTAEE